MMKRFDAPIDDIRRHSSLYLALGIGIALLGAVALILEIFATVASVAVFGAIVAVAGTLQIVGAFRAQGVGHIFLYFLVGIVDIVIGAIIMSHPLAGALFLTLFLASMFLVGGFFRIVGALVLRYSHYAWAAVSGVVSVVLGVLLWTQWPFSGLWFIGFYVGINLIFLGASWISLATHLRGSTSVAAAVHA